MGALLAMETPHVMPAGAPPAYLPETTNADGTIINMAQMTRDETQRVSARNPSVQVKDLGGGFLVPDNQASAKAGLGAMANQLALQLQAGTITQDAFNRCMTIITPKIQPDPAVLAAQAAAAAAAAAQAAALAAAKQQVSTALATGSDRQIASAIDSAVKVADPTAVAGTKRYDNLVASIMPVQKDRGR